MRSAELEAAIAACGAGLEAQLSLLRQLESLAARERQASLADDLDLVTRISDERTRLMAGLLLVENEIKPLRPLLSQNRAAAESLPGFADVVALHHVASRLVNTILTADAETLRILHDASASRQAALASLEHGGQTLSAYRRVIAPPVSQAALFESRG